ncbi:DUF7221 family queuine tRNA-ribosyltransferase-like protein [Actinoplanes sp. CA-054009]
MSVHPEPQPATAETVGRPGITYVIPCGAAKLDRPAAARDLYTGQHFRHALANVQRLAALDDAEGRGPTQLLILSAHHGLVDPDTILDPYEQRMDAPGAITATALTAQALKLGIDWGSQVYAAVPKPYLARLDQALREIDVYVQDIYEGTASIGEQRRVLSIIGRPSAEPAAPAGPGPAMWLGGDVHAFAWGVPLMVSYGRLRHARVLPVAGQPWVIDSRGFHEIAEHGRWTIDAAQYVNDLRRYRDEIGHLVWAAPQDWPAAPPMIERTGLSEEEHQQRTTASVLQLRALTPDVDIIAVVTGTTAAGYLNHCRIYAEAGIDLRLERLPVGIGALVGRSATEAADIIRVLYAAGLHRLHGFGVKGPVLDLVGGLLHSIDSASWAQEARLRQGHCPHGLVRWERNCPLAAQQWGDRQRQRGARAQVQPMLPLFEISADT